MKKNIVIIGAHSSIGSIVTMNLLKDGYRVFAVIGPNDNPGFLYHHNLEVFQLDLTDSDDIREFIKLLTQIKEIKIHATICTIPSCHSYSSRHTSFEGIQDMIGLNFKKLCDMAYPVFASKKGLLQLPSSVLVDSNQGVEQTLGKNIIAYSLSKSLIFTLSEKIDPYSNEVKVKVSVMVIGNLESSSAPYINLNRLVHKDEAYTLIASILSGKTGMRRTQPYHIYNNTEV